MGYELHITRNFGFGQRDNDKISESEWENLIQEEREMQITGKAEITTPDGETITFTNPLLAIWNGHPEYETVWFDYHDGEISVKNPDEVVIKKMVDLAKKLNARVQGDDGEFYDQI